MSFSGYEDQRLPRELDDYEYDQLESDPWLCECCGDDLPAEDEIHIGDKYVCRECACVLNAERWCEELAARVEKEAA